MKFDESFINRVRNSVNLIDLISGYVRLKKQGKDYAALCPFHNEKTPSFLVSESKGIFKCFGCGTGGDVFKFIMLVENLTFPESIAHLAERYGIPLPASSEQSARKTQKRQHLLQIMERATEFYRRCLHENRNALNYLRERQINEEIIDRFSIGYAPASRELTDKLKRESFKIEEILACGLIKEGNTGRYYEKFRNRIVFPIRDFSGKTIAFGGRVLGEGVPKYLNSPETALYNKGSHLFPLHLTRDEIRRRDFAVLVEGYFDCIVPFQFGIQNVVASLGTSLTEEQVKVLGRYTRNVIINYDPDSAGTNAAFRSIDLFLEQGFHVNVLHLPDGEDPDDFIRKNGADAYREHLRASQPYLEFALSRFIIEQRDPRSPKGKQEIVSRILPYLVKIPSSIERAEYVTRIASRLQIDENLMMLELRKMSRPREKSRAVVSVATEQMTNAESTLLSALLDPDWAEEVIGLLDGELVEDLPTERIFEKAFELKKKEGEIRVVRLREALEENECHLLESVALRPSECLLSQETIRGSVRALRAKQYERLSRQIQDEIRRKVEAASRTEDIDELLAKKSEIRRKMEETERQ